MALSPVPALDGEGARLLEAARLIELHLGDEDRAADDDHADDDHGQDEIEENDQRMTNGARARRRRRNRLGLQGFGRALGRGAAEDDVRRADRDSASSPCGSLLASAISSALALILGFEAGRDGDCSTEYGQSGMDRVAQA